MIDAIYLMQRELLRRKYSNKTIKTYLTCINKFLGFCNKEPRKITKKDVREYLDELLKKNVTGNTINVHLNAIKFLLREILNKNFLFKIKYSKAPKKLPVVLTKEEVKRLIDSIDNKKHKLMIKLMYSSGLRVSELIKLKVKDLEFKKNYGWVRGGKGNKDRMFIIAKTIKKDLKNFIKENKLIYDFYLFKGQKYNYISARTIQGIIKKACRKAKIKKKINTHTLRHSFATHLIENGYDINSVQNLLGHNSSQTTMMYIHIANPRMIDVKSPLDSL